ncbi:chymotrypsin family serine protease [Corynebacterium uterequi]|uniref:hypothetical protein n=1 Tax=Corynebacterium uterequi TaxID=1072256 RepID=UPI0011875DC4|nr:hypothetical protein [Corynebacterium uterequi]
MSRITAAVATTMAAAALVPPASAVTPGEALLTVGGTRSLDCTAGPVLSVERPGQPTARIMLTAGHCATDDAGWQADAVYSSSGARVGALDKVKLAANTPGETLAGFIRMTTGADWATVLVDDSASGAVIDTPDGDVELTGVRDYRPTGLKEVSFDNAGDPICKIGLTTGHTCGTQLFRTYNSVYSSGLGFAPGDSGGINYDPRTGEIIGITVENFGAVGRTQTADAILQDAYGLADGEVATAAQVAH